MKYGKVLRVLVVILLIFSFMPAVPFAVHAADSTKTQTIVGWRQWTDPDDGITDIGVYKVLVNDEELPQDGGSVTIGPEEEVWVDVYFKSGYKLGYYVEVGIFVNDVNDYNEKTNTGETYNNMYNVRPFDSAHSRFETAVEERFYDGKDLYIVIPVMKMTEEELAYQIDSVDLTIKAPEAGTVITATPDEYSYYGYDTDTQDPYPDVSIPSDVNYFFYDDGNYAVYFEPEVPSPFDRFDLKLYVSNEDHPELKDGDKLLAGVILVPEDEYSFADDVKVNVTGGTFVASTIEDGYLLVFIMVTVGGEPVPDTGDVSDIWLWTVISVASAMALAGVLVYRKKLQ